MAIFQFFAVNAKTGLPVKCAITLGGKSRGFTPERKGEYLVVETEMSGRFSWYAKRYGDKVDSGESEGGRIRIVVS